jgi:hypothetical protein
MGYCLEALIDCQVIHLGLKYGLSIAKEPASIRSHSARRQLSVLFSLCLVAEQARPIRNTLLKRQDDNSRAQLDAIVQIDGVGIGHSDTTGGH